MRIHPLRHRSVAVLVGKNSTGSFTRKADRTEGKIINLYPVDWPLESHTTENDQSQSKKQSQLVLSSCSPRTAHSDPPLCPDPAWWWAGTHKHTLAVVFVAPTQTQRETEEENRCGAHIGRHTDTCQMHQCLLLLPSFSHHVTWLKASTICLNPSVVSRSLEHIHLSHSHLGSEYLHVIQIVPQRCLLYPLINKPSSKNLKENPPLFHAAWRRNGHKLRLYVVFTLYISFNLLLNQVMIFFFFALIIKGWICSI